MNLKFNIHDKVKLPKEIHKELTGNVISIWIGEDGIQYKIRYFWECKPNEIYFYESELEKV
jgi:hypothetical protein